MATCTYCTAVIERIGQPITEQTNDDGPWSVADSATDAKPAGDVRCMASPTRVHVPAITVAVMWYSGPGACHWPECTTEPCLRVSDLLSCLSHFTVAVTAAMRRQLRQIEGP